MGVGVTGREVLEKLAGDKRIALAVYEAGYVCVPREPTKEMLDAAYWAALAEDPTDVWSTMISVSEGVLTGE